MWVAALSSVVQQVHSCMLGMEPAATRRCSSSPASYLATTAAMAKPRELLKFYNTVSREILLDLPSEPPMCFPATNTLGTVP